ncbi:MAG: TolC family protein [Sulfurimonas sp.]|uniref:TolC family protein n=1 Tax=Sulfurimonas sp. TaxID=2022749 RepID=UPI0026142957|nr:TolC family protein [Sulfurimonas sp.]MCW8895954.1 TolC family protein [Sulfurimonas sp.]MCW8954799.1 TolC family protein [Sulfurimonas sp.]MCW9067253.1 TolC family protein [Sulfurimonas sp.]
MRFLFPLLCLPVFLYSYTLDELIELSQKNRVVESAVHIVTAKEKGYESTKSSYLPSLELGATYQNAYEESVSLAENSIKVQASLKYTLYDGGKKGSLYKQLKSGIDSSKESVEAIKNSISLDVSRLYFEFMALNADKQATQQEIEQLKAEFRRLELFYESGSVTKDELDKIDATLKGALVSLYEIDLEREKILHALEYFTTQKVDTLQSGAKINLADEGSVGVRHDIKSLEHDAAALLYEAKGRESENMPKVYFDSTLSYSDYYFDNKPATNFLVDTQNIAMIYASWNIFDFGSTTKSYESKYEEYLSKRVTIEHEKHKADVDYRLAKKSLEIAKLKIAATKAALDAATSAYELIKFKYQNGTIDNVAYLLALSQKYDAARNHERALYNLEIKKAELIYYSAKDIKEFL